MRHRTLTQSHTRPLLYQSGYARWRCTLSKAHSLCALSRERQHGAVALPLLKRGGGDRENEQRWRAKLKKDGEKGQADRARVRGGEVTAGRVEDERGSRPTPGVSLTRHAPLPRWGTRRSTNTQGRRCLCVHVACVTRNSSLPSYTTVRVYATRRQASPNDLLAAAR